MVQLGDATPTGTEITPRQLTQCEYESEESNMRRNNSKSKDPEKRKGRRQPLDTSDLLIQKMRFSRPILTSEKPTSKVPMLRSDRIGAASTRLTNKNNYRLLALDADL
jgi:hypothetical protein